MNEWMHSVFLFCFDFKVEKLNCPPSPTSSLYYWCVSWTVRCLEKRSQSTGNGANEGIYIFFVFFNNKIKLAKNSGKEREKLP